MPAPLERLFRLQIIGVSAFNAVDYFLTLEALENGYSEANPILAPMIGSFEFPLVKLVLVPLLLIFIWQKRNRVGKPLVTMTWIPFMSYFSLMVYYVVHF